MWFWQVKQALKTAFCVAVCAPLALLFFVLSRFSLPKGENAEYYLYSPSSQAEISPSLALADLLFLTGQSAEYEVQEGELFLPELLLKYRARVWFTEEVCGVKSYYCYSPMLGKTCLLKGYPVNLHVAIKGTWVKVGAPVVFGGY